MVGKVAPREVECMCQSSNVQTLKRCSLRFRHPLPESSRWLTPILAAANQPAPMGEKPRATRRKAVKGCRIPVNPALHHRLHALPLVLAWNHEHYD